MGTRPNDGAAAGYVARVRALLAPAKSLDQAQRKLDNAGTNATLKEAFDVASRRASGSPTGENLELLEKATKALRRGAPQAEKARAAFNEAERKFKLELGAIARDFRA